MRQSWLFTQSLLLALLVAGNVPACRKPVQEPQPTRASTEPAPSVSLSASASKPEPIAQAPYRFPAPARLVAVGDLHGDLAAARSALEIAGAVDARGHWVGGALTLVQTGDVLDRGDDEREILEWLDELNREAARSGGAVHLLNGNHEVLNVQGDFRYVTPGGVADFEDVDPEGNPALRGRLSLPLRRRAVAFAPGGVWAKRLAAHPTVAVVGRTAFAHGGLSPKDVRFGLGRINAGVTAWMKGQAPELPEELRGDDSPFWSRAYAAPRPAEETCQTLGEVLRAIDADRLVVGHTPQVDGIGSACQGKLWRIDVGLSKAYGAASPQALEIRGDHVEVLRSRASSR